jgi:hypothetical protein
LSACLANEVATVPPGITSLKGQGRSLSPQAPLRVPKHNAVTSALCQGADWIRLTGSATSTSLQHRSRRSKLCAGSRPLASGCRHLPSEHRPPTKLLRDQGLVRVGSRNVYTASPRSSVTSCCPTFQLEAKQHRTHGTPHRQPKSHHNALSVPSGGAARPRANALCRALTKWMSVSVKLFAQQAWSRYDAAMGAACPRSAGPRVWPVVGG